MNPLYQAYKIIEELQLIETFIAYVDDHAGGFQDEQNQQFIGMLTMPKVFRSQKQNITDLIPV